MTENLFFLLAAITITILVVWNLLLRKENQKFRECEKDSRWMTSAVEHSPSIVFITNKNGVIQYVNPKFVEITGFSQEEAIGRNPRILQSGTRSKEEYGQLWHTILAGQEWRGEFPNKRKNGELYWASASISSITDSKGEIVNFVCVQEDITEKKHAEEEIRFLANHDALTGLPSLRLSKDRLKQAISAAKRHGDKVALMFIDLDRFKAVNDNLGHEAGDMVLRESAARLKGCIRESDTLARIGGDEFIVILTDVKDETGPSSVAGHIITALTEDFAVNGDIASIGASIGIALYPDDASDPEDLLRKADVAMYAVKESGRNRFKFASPMDFYQWRV